MQRLEGKAVSDEKYCEEKIGLHGGVVGRLQYSGSGFKPVFTKPPPAVMPSPGTHAFRQNGIRERHCIVYTGRLWC